MEASGIVKGVSGIAGSIPYVGPIISAVGGIVGGVLEQEEAKKQAEQAARARKEAMNLKPDALNPEFKQALQSAKMAELGGLPGLELWKQQLGAKSANNLRSILESSPSGAATLAAMSAAIGSENNALNELAIQDMAYKQEQNKEVRDLLWQTGLQKRGLEDRRDVWKREGLQSASALENAATYNKVNSINKILGSITSTASSLTSNVSDGNKDALWSNYLQQLSSPSTTEQGSGVGQFTEYQSGATLPTENNMWSPLNYSTQLGQ